MVSLPGIWHTNVKSCCCFSVKTGSLIIGFLGVIASVINVIQFTVNILKDSNNQDLKWYIPFCMAIYGSYFISGLINYLLIRGVQKEKPQLMYPWIYISYVGFITGLLLSIIGLGVMIFLLFNNPNVTIGLVLIYIGLLIILFAIGYYFFAAVVTHCQDLLANQANELPHHQQQYGNIP